MIKKPVSPRMQRIRENLRTLFAFIALQVFFVVMVASFSYKAEFLLGLMVLVPPLFCILQGRTRYIYAVYFISMVFSIGQRTIYLGHDLRFVPSEVLLYLMAFLSLFTRPTVRVPGGQVPRIVYYLVAATLPAYMLSIISGHNMDLCTFYAKYTWLVLPAFLVITRIVVTREQIENIVVILSFSCMFLSALAIVEFFNFPVAKYFSAYLRAEKTIMGQEGFKRLGAAFWGGPMLAAFITMCMPLILARWLTAKTIINKVLIAASFMLGLLVIYYSGHRGIWVPFMVAMAIYFVMKGARGAVIFIIIGLLLSVYTPEIGKARFKTLLHKEHDTSLTKRSHRAEDAWKIFLKNPVFGSGWGTNGLVHVDWIQFAADGGVFVPLSYLSLFLLIWRKLLRGLKKHREKKDKEYLIAFFCSTVAGFLILGTQSFFNLPEQYTPFWFIVALSYQLPGILQLDKTLRMQPAMELKEVSIKTTETSPHV